MANEQKDQELPNGFRLEQDTTGVGNMEYPVEYPQAESLDAILDYYASQGLDESPEDIVRDIWNSAEKQGAVQTHKGPVREALNTGEYKVGSGEDAVTLTGEEAVETAMEEAQGKTRAHFIGAPMGSRAGPTKKQAQNFGLAIAKAQQEKGDTLTQQELADLREEYGV